MIKATKEQELAISELVEDTFTYELCKDNGRGSFTYEDMRRTIQATFGDLEFNWVAVVRSPMQELMAEGFMKRDTSDLSVERYIR